MAFASEFEYEDELKLLDWEYEGPFNWKTREWFQLRTNEAGGLEARVSGFGWRADRPILKERPKGDVLKAHQEAVYRICREIERRATAGSCVKVIVNGFADPVSESRDAKTISENRANAFFGRLWERLLYAGVADKVRRDVGGQGAEGLWRGDTPLEKMLNRRVKVFAFRTGCGK